MRLAATTGAVRANPRHDVAGVSWAMVRTLTRRTRPAPSLGIQRDAIGIEVDIDQHRPRAGRDPVERDEQVGVASYAVTRSAQGGGDCSEVWPLERREGRIHVAIAELDVLHPVGAVVEHDHYEVESVANGGVELGDTSQHEPAIAC